MSVPVAHPLKAWIKKLLFGSNTRINYTMGGMRNMCVYDAKWGQRHTNILQRAHIQQKAAGYLG